MVRQERLQLQSDQAAGEREHADDKSDFEGTHASVPVQRGLIFSRRRVAASIAPMTRQKFHVGAERRLRLLYNSFDAPPRFDRSAAARDRFFPGAGASLDWRARWIKPAGPGARAAPGEAHGGCASRRFPEQVAAFRRLPIVRRGGEGSVVRAST
jgi:hypothetical protein